MDSLDTDPKDGEGGERGEGGKGESQLLEADTALWELALHCSAPSEEL